MEKKSQYKVLHLTTIPMSLYFLENQLKFLKQNDFEVHVLSSPGILLDNFCISEEVVKHEVEIQRNISILKDLIALLKITRIILKYKFDIIHTHTPKASLLGIIAGKIAGVKIRIYHLHGLPFVTNEGIKKKILYYAEKLTCMLATKVYAVSPSLRKYVIEKNIVSERKIKVIRNGSINGLDSIEKFNPQKYDVNEVKRELNISKEDFLMGYIGRITKDKGIVELITAWEKINILNPKVKLLLVGPIEKNNQLPKEIIHEILHNKDIIFTGFVKLTAPYYMVMDVCVFPTYREGFGMTAIEAMAMEVPVIASEVIGCVDTVNDEKNGFLIPAKSPESIIEKVNYYLENRKLINKHGRYGRNFVKVHYEQYPIWKELVRDYTSYLK
ncbi:glycosyltransferase family 4 protein [Pueribacillus sp. YX66]|uniref:glycosyltransferase family 4 protein n=1 Tax=Pueribacillus sp. YX66 TaxID=3229242 RepID=UPI00358CEABF